ncbi:MAG TPA: hypothetical protein DEG17_11080 [Cyanobacteria bacterium UBA11149]|nr:hypothetical protein [Cyanobacteria bacterium UBA11367]HBE57590.1 hypothetical protein [Cyanobacteria bacterium UBA11366]HBK62542.1 hypothetical protein [Cyanobacteria bacterium UBA11166]HBR77058.1 hypothetical protein [Cyanobacteria bacterium UBA11159]HBS72001.1 hypothetical protein [Cyanobacteria bacterium UBA11153]HBW89392.1 hypothetical protein [Cyanobacteria bacterium UBA11149]HCA97337.1 hypothetical protein [Cyanobacteria bacterium UBA9226]
MKKAPLIEKISLKGLVIAPSQVWGAIRLVPLLREKPRQDLRLFKREYDSDITLVSVKNNLHYISYIPHGLVLTWSDDNLPIAAIGGQLIHEGKKIACNPLQVKILHRMAKREEKNRLRLLPLHLAMEGFLSMFFSGPTIAWKEYSKQALSQGLSPRVESSITGFAIAHLENALRVFEIHEHQVGVLLFVSDILASAFILPTPDDYRLLHTSLLEDFYGETFYYYGRGIASHLEVKIDESTIHNLADLKQALAQMHSEWASFQGFMAGDLLNRGIQSKRVYTAGKFSLQRFITDLSLTQNNYIGEFIIDESAELQYLKIYGLSNAQTKRIYLLQKLAANNWNFEYTAYQEGNTLEELVDRIEKAGFGYLINNQLREKSRKSKR